MVAEAKGAIAEMGAEGVVALLLLNVGMSALFYLVIPQSEPKKNEEITNRREGWFELLKEARPITNPHGVGENLPNPVSKTCRQRTRMTGSCRRRRIIRPTWNIQST